MVWDAAWGLRADTPHQLDVGVTANEWANDRAVNWCAADATVSPTGTPAADNVACPGAELDADGDGWTRAAGDCDDTDADVFPGADDGPEVDDDGDCNGVRDDSPADTGVVDTGDTGTIDTGAPGDTGAVDSADTAPDTADTARDTADSGDSPPDGVDPHPDPRPGGCGCGSPAPGSPALGALLGALLGASAARRRPAESTTAGRE